MKYRVMDKQGEACVVEADSIDISTPGYIIFLTESQGRVLYMNSREIDFIMKETYIEQFAELNT